MQQGRTLLKLPWAHMGGLEAHQHGSFDTDLWGGDPALMGFYP